MVYKLFCSFRQLAAARCNSPCSGLAASKAAGRHLASSAVVRGCRRLEQRCWRGPSPNGAGQRCLSSSSRTEPGAGVGAGQGAPALAPVPGTLPCLWGTSARGVGGTLERPPCVPARRQVLPPAMTLTGRPELRKPVGLEPGPLPWAGEPLPSRGTSGEQSAPTAAQRQPHAAHE